VLLAEDDRAIRHALERALSLEGYEVTAVADGVEALAHAHRERPDVLVLDVMMPGIDGLQVCRVLRAEGDRTPILMLTALVETADRIAGLDAGADDYVVKPFAMEELLARLRAISRRRADPAGRLRIGDLVLDPEQQRAWRGDCELDLSRREFAVLRVLMENAGRVVSRLQLLNEVWDGETDLRSNAIDVHVSKVRAKVDRAFARATITTLRGRGYRLETAP
jgi:DNA-binding response OmpR family regulator